MDKELTADEIKRFYDYLRKINVFCKETPFKRKARFWQIEWSKKHHLTLEPNKKEVLLSKDDTENGKNFYEDFGIFKKWVEGKRLETKDKKFDPGVYKDMLRSEHIPFNIFVPLYESNGKAYLKEVLNHILDKEIKDDDIRKNKEIFEIEDLDSDFKMIEYAPPSPSGYLNDNTSFDAYIEYKNNKGDKCIIGIEIKYTEPCSAPAFGKKEYFKVTKGIYNDSFIKEKKYEKRMYNQLWRNHLLGESILLKGEFKHFTSITIYPEGNKHIGDAGKDYVKFLEKGHEYDCLFFTYKELFDYIEKELCKDDERYLEWIKWMEKRYIVKDDEIRKICQL